MYVLELCCLWRAKFNPLAQRRFEIEQGTAHATALDEGYRLEREAEVVCSSILVCRRLPLGASISCGTTCYALHSSCHIWSAMLPPNRSPPVPLSNHNTTEADGAAWQTVLGPLIGGKSLRCLV